jgi:hypothetical protein
MFGSPPAFQEFPGALGVLVRLNGLQGSAMSSTREHRGNHRKVAIAAGTGNVASSDQVGANIVSDGEGDFIDQTVAIWQKHTERQLTREDGREIIENMSGFFRILREWDRAERAAKKTKKRLRTGYVSN